MKASIIFTVITATLTSETLAQRWGGAGAWGADFPSCASSCAPQWDANTYTGSNWGGYLCDNETAIANVNSCISSSSCSDADKSSTYQRIASLCAASGTTITAAPEASFTGSLLLSYSGPGPWSSGWSSGSGPGPGGPGGHGPFGGGFGNFQSSGPWTSGPWTSWWNHAGCPDSTWSGWTSGPWTSGGPWTSWTACTATTTATSTFTTTNSAGAVVTSTGFGIKVAQNSGTSTGAAGASATPNVAVGRVGGQGRRVVALGGALLGVSMLVMVIL